ncbi:MAG TPA: hypothetical protein VD930_13825 [Gemmatimonadales bacterium]|nr:hypothetical protein [Gemmatimonadales bacterium]
MSEQGQIERLAREWMGYEVVERSERHGDAANIRIGNAVLGEAPPCFCFADDGSLILAGSKGRLWNPFTDANADVQVLERAREHCGSGNLATLALHLEVAWRGRWGYQADTPVSLRYQVGDYARAALAVLEGS